MYAKIYGKFKRPFHSDGKEKRSFAQSSCFVITGVILLVLLGIIAISSVARSERVPGHFQSVKFHNDTEDVGRFVVRGIREADSKDVQSDESNIGCRKTILGSFTCEDRSKYKFLLEKYGTKKIVTAYNSVPEQTDGSPCISADGSNICELLEYGEVTCAASLPFGSVLWIDGLGTCTVHDRLAQKYSGRIDLYFGGAEHVQDARRFGKQELLVIQLE